MFWVVHFTPVLLLVRQSTTFCCKSIFVFITVHFISGTTFGNDVPANVIPTQPTAQNWKLWVKREKMIGGNFYRQLTHGWHFHRLDHLVYISEILSDTHQVSYFQNRCEKSHFYGHDLSQISFFKSVLGLKKPHWNSVLIYLLSADLWDEGATERWRGLSQLLQPQPPKHHDWWLLSRVCVCLCCVL